MTDQPADQPFVPAGQRVFVLIAAILASAMAFIDGSVVSIATPAIRATLGASLADVQWVSNGYLLMLSSLLLLGGAAGDRFGLRNIFAGGIGLFVLASIASAAAPSPAFLIGARALQGLGAALMVPGSLAIIAKAYPRAERGAAIGLWAAASSLTTMLGPVVGGTLLTWLGDWSWRLIFAINLPLGGIALALLLAKVPADTPSAGGRLDLVGAASITVALLLISLAFIDPADRFWLYLIGGLVFTTIFVAWEARTASPMLPLRLFRDKAFSGAQGLTLALYFGLSAISFYLPMTLISGWGTPEALVALVLLPVGVAMTLLSPQTGKLTDRLGPGPVIAGGSLLVGLAFFGLGLTEPLHNLWGAVLPLMALFGIGLSAVAGPISTAVMTAVADSETGTASAVNNAVARVAGLLAVAMMGALAAFVFSLSAPASLSFGQIPDAALADGAEAVRISATDAAFSTVAYVTAGLAVVSAILAWTTLKHGRKATWPEAVDPARFR